jgi:hypothetical protein
MVPSKSVKKMILGLERSVSGNGILFLPEVKSGVKERRKRRKKREGQRHEISTFTSNRARLRIRKSLQTEQKSRNQLEGNIIIRRRRKKGGTLRGTRKPSTTTTSVLPAANIQGARAIGIFSLLRCKHSMLSNYTRFC